MTEDRGRMIEIGIRKLECQMGKAELCDCRVTRSLHLVNRNPKHATRNPKHTTRNS
jgi:hypothetical protein